MRLKRIGKPSSRKGKKQSEESKRKNREWHLGRKAPNGVGIGKGDWYITKFGEKIWLRSTYEIEYARYLDRNNIYWLYESECFKLSDILPPWLVLSRGGGSVNEK